LPLEEITIAELLKGAGYKTAMFGKWHLGHRPQWLPSSQGFDEYLSILYSNDMTPVQLVEADEVVEYPVDQSILTQRYTQRAIDFIFAARDAAQATRGIKRLLHAGDAGRSVRRRDS
jgi:uncharacterized sulfatase